MSSKLYYTSPSPIDVSRKTVIFIHAAFMSSTMWTDQIKALQASFPDTNLLQIDVNGHGKTTHGRKTYTLYDQCDDIAELMEQLSIRSAVFVGISMGSLISLRMALKYPSRVDGIVAMSSISRAATKEVIEVFTQFYNGWVSTTTPSEELMNLAIVGWGGDNVNVNSDRAKIIKRDWTERYSGIVNVEGIAESLNTRDDIVDELTHVKCPVSLIHGEMDTTWGVEEAEIELEKLRDGELKIVKGEGHMLIFIREAEDVNGWIEEFLKKLGY